MQNRQATFNKILSNIFQRIRFLKYLMINWMQDLGFWTFLLFIKPDHIKFAMMPVIPHSRAAVTDHFHNWITDCCPKCQNIRDASQCQHACAQSLWLVWTKAYERCSSAALRCAQHQCMHNWVLDVRALAGRGGCWMRHYIYIISWWSLSHNLSARLQSVTSARQLSCIMLTWLRHVSSAQLQCVSSAAICKLQSVSSTAMCRLRCTLSAQLPLVNSAVSSAANCQPSCKLSAQLSTEHCQLSLEFVRSAATCQLSCNWSAH